MIEQEADYLPVCSWKIFRLSFVTRSHLTRTSLDLMPAQAAGRRTVISAGPLTSPPPPPLYNLIVESSNTKVNRLRDLKRRVVTLSKDVILLRRAVLFLFLAIIASTQLVGCRRVLEKLGIIRPKSAPVYFEYLNKSPSLAGLDEEPADGPTGTRQGQFLEWAISRPQKG